MKPLVSVIMPVYNGGEFLKAAIYSILTQRFRDFEFIIINDGSTDHSASVIRSIPDRRIQYVENDGNIGLIRTLNKGIAMANGEYIARMDADDLAEPERLELQVEFLQSHPAHGMCGTFYRLINAAGSEEGKLKLPEADLETRTYLLFGNCFCHSSILIRSSLARLYGYDSEYELCEDYELWSRISCDQHQMANLPYYALNYRIHGNNVSIKKRQQMLSRVSKIHARGLRSYHIPYDEQELVLHSAFLSFDHAYCSEQGFDRVEAWAIKLCRQLESHPDLAVDLAIRVIIRRWVTNCFNAGEYWRLFDNLLFREYGRFYLRCFGEKVLDKWSASNRGYDL